MGVRRRPVDLWNFDPVGTRWGIPRAIAGAEQSFAFHLRNIITIDAETYYLDSSYDHH